METTSRSAFMLSSVSAPRVKHVKCICHFLAMFCIAALQLHAGTSEFRGFWVDAFHGGFDTSSKVTKLVADVRAANCNAILIEVRKRGDAFYNSNFEPKSPSIAAAFDPLADIIKKAHDTNTGPRIEVHAWMTMYPVWRGADGFPKATNHPYALHRDWLLLNSHGDNYDGRDFSLDPGHPAVQEHLFNVVMDVVSHYDVDGINLDYIHYPSREWGYNPVAVDRFNAETKRKGKPDRNDPRWGQFRRDQVTGLVRKIYLSAIEKKPQIKISAATITWPPVPAIESEWSQRTPAYVDVFQDWRGWMEEGIIDIGIPMVYVPYTTQLYKSIFYQWGEFAKNHRYNRHVVITPALYMNTLSNSFAEIEMCRQPSKTGQTADGVCLYSYASFASDKTSQAEFLSSLTSRENGVFTKPATCPEMPWKSKPTNGYLKGFVRDSISDAPIDGAIVTLTGTKPLKTKTDATGFYGFVDLPPGEYAVSYSASEHDPATGKLRVSHGNVSNRNVSLTPSAARK